MWGPNKWSSDASRRASGLLLPSQGRGRPRPTLRLRHGHGRCSIAAIGCHPSHSEPVIAVTGTHPGGEGRLMRGWLPTCAAPGPARPCPAHPSRPRRPVSEVILGSNPLRIKENLAGSSAWPGPDRPDSARPEGPRPGRGRPAAETHFRAPSSELPSRREPRVRPGRVDQGPTPRAARPRRATQGPARAR